MGNELTLKINKRYICAKFQDDQLIFNIVIVQEIKRKYNYYMHIIITKFGNYFYMWNELLLFFIAIFQF